MIDIKRHTFSSPLLQGVVNDAVTFFERTPDYELPPPDGFGGLGVYAIYYLGDHEQYKHLAAANKSGCKLPIYVGKAVPTGWRTGRSGGEDEKKTVGGRLREHQRSILKTKTLNVRDFRCRFMILQGTEADLISTVEAALIRRYRPMWNTLIDGFGNHDPGSGRYNQAKSEWDVLHPGREWADRCTGKCATLSQILSKIRDHQRPSLL
jgi:hypothetical protein